MGKVEATNISESSRLPTTRGHDRSASNTWGGTSDRWRAAFIGGYVTEMDSNNGVSPRSEYGGMTRSPQTELEALEQFLDFYRTVLARKAEGLTSEQLKLRAAASSLTLGGLVKHMALVEDHWFTNLFADEPMPDPWASASWDDDPDWEMTSAREDSPSDLLDLYDLACDRSRVVVAAAPSLDAAMPAKNAGRHGATNLRWIMLHMIEEYARHTGHADLIREAIDGQSGD